MAETPSHHLIYRANVAPSIIGQISIPGRDGRQWRAVTAEYDEEAGTTLVGFVLHHPEEESNG